MEEKFKRWLETEDGREEICNLHQRLRVESKRIEKSEAVCQELKFKGTEAFLNKRLEEAHKLYSEALQRAPADSASIPLLYGNRSASSFEMNLIKDCLSDIENAERAEFPQNLKCRLIMRKVRCLLKLSRKDESIAAIEELKEISTKSNLKGVDHKSISALSEACQNLQQVNTQGTVDNEIDLKSCLYNGESSNLCSMSESLEIRSNPNEGRYVITNRKIPKGSVLVTEKPFAAILLHENALTHCQMCLKETNTPIPCQSCCDVVFCTTSCQRLADTFHRYECPILPTLSRFRIAHLALRLLLVAGLNTCRKIREEVENISMDLEGTKVGSTKEDQYRAVYSRVTHLDKLNPEDELNYATVAITLSELLMEKTSFIEDQCINNNEDLINYNRKPNGTAIEHFNPDCALNRDSKSYFSMEAFQSRLKIELSCILLHHITLVISNGHGIDEYRRCPKGADELSPVVLKQIGSAIYPSSSLMNHSCKIYTMNSFVGDVLIIHNVEDLNPGDQVYTCYGPHVGDKCIMERQKKLEKQYFFKCACLACTDQSYIIEEEGWTGIKCPVCGGIASWKDIHGATIDLQKLNAEEFASMKDGGVLQCRLCESSDTPHENMIEEISLVLKLNSEALNYLDDGKLAQAKKNLLEALTRGSIIFDSRNEFLNTTRKTLSKTLAQCGEIESCLRELLLYLEYIKDRYGAESTTAAFEMIRVISIVNLWSNYGYTNLLDTEEMKEKIKSIFTRNYGTRWRNYVKIDEF